MKKPATAQKFFCARPAMARAANLLVGLSLGTGLCAGFGTAHAEEVKCDADLVASEKAHVNLALADIMAQANSGDLVAQNELGRRYGMGNGLAKSSVTSFNWYEKAAASGLCSAQTNLAYMYLNGEGVQKNPFLAQIWYNKAANQGDERAQYALGYLNLVGTEIPKNGAVAEKWFLLAANRGYVSAQQALVVLYRDGDGQTIAKDPDKANLWFTRVRDASTTGKAWKQD